MDRGTARSFVALKAEDPEQSINTPAQYNEALDLAEEQFAIETRSIFKSTTLTVVDNQNYVTAPTDLLVCILARHKGLKLSPTSPYDLSFQNGTDWTTITGTPTKFYIDNENERVILAPIPQAADAGAFLDLMYAAIPANITSDSTVLLNARALLAVYHPAIVAWAADWILSYRTATQAILIKQNSLKKEYEKYRDQAIETYKNMQDQPSQMKGGRNWQDTSNGGTSNAFTDN